MEKQVNLYKIQIDSLLSQIENYNSLINEQKHLLAIQLSEIENQKMLRQKQLINIINDSLTILSQKRMLANKQLLLLQKSDSLLFNTELLHIQYSELRSGKNDLEKQKSQIDSINNEIANKNLILSNQDDKIIKQRQIMLLFATIIFLIIVLVIFILKANQQSRKKSKELVRQKGEIEKINKKLLINNTELTYSIEEIKRMHQKLVQAEKMASLGVLTAGIAHEINNPINFVYAGINTLLRDFEDIEPVIREISKINPETDDIKSKLLNIEKLKEEFYFNEAYEAIPLIIADIKLGADRTAEIIKGLRNFSQTDKGMLSKYNIHEGIDSSLLLLKNKYKNKTEIRKNFDENIPEIKCFPCKINQALLNIFSNAIDAITENGIITVTTQLRENEVLISIKDNGCGISEEIKEKLFDPFFTTKPVGMGTGLGLSITYGIIKEHNGTIEVNSELGKGTEFVIILPIIKD